MFDELAVLLEITYRVGSEKGTYEFKVLFHLDENEPVADLEGEE